MITLIMAPRVCAETAPAVRPVAAGLSQADANSAATRDWRNIETGSPMPDEGYCDQPYVVVNDDGSWTCVLTTGKGHEGQSGQHFVATVSKDQGKTWTPLIDIEPADGPEASYGVPLIVPGGRIYAFYTYNGDRIDTLPGGERKIRADMLGWYCYKYSDDGGKTWSNRYRIPIRTTACDLANQWKGKVQIFWGIDKPKVSDVGVTFCITKLGKYMLDNGEGWMLHSDNILTESDPGKIHWALLPDGENGLRVPEFGSVQEEHNHVTIGKGRLYLVYRTTLGYPMHCYSEDGGHTWTKPEHMTYSPDGRKIKTPRACPKLWRCKNGKYLFWFHNHSGKTFEGRNPVWVSGGVVRDGKMYWSEPEILLYHNNAGERGMSYPDLIEQDGKYWVTETQKTIARVHQIDPALLEGLWAQFDGKGEVTKDGLVLSLEKPVTQADKVKMPRLPNLSSGGGFAIDLWLQSGDFKEGQIILDSRDEKGRGVALAVADEGSVRLYFSDGRSPLGQWTSEPGLLKEGQSHHITAIVDGGPNIITFVVDGKLCDGGESRQYGWGRFDEKVGGVNGAGTLRLSPSFTGSILSLRIYDRAIRTSEAVANHQADAKVKPVKRPDGSPHLSDVSMRLFHKREDQAELKAARAFHITRADWSYIKDPEYIKMVKQQGWIFQGAMNAVTHNADHAMRTKDGEPMLDHFGKPGRYWADMDNASYRQWYLDQLMEWAKLGVDSIQRDEPTTCRRTPVPDAARFFEETRAEFEKRLGRHMPASCNLASFGSMFGGKGDAVTKLFDFGMAEIGTQQVRPDFFLLASRDTRRRGKAMVFTAYRDLGVPNYRLSIATCYATGMNFIVPWDQYAGVNQPRVFSRPQDLADLYGFVRANARYLDGYEDVAAKGYRLEDSSWGKTPALSIEGNDKVTAFVRAKPGDDEAPVVVHLIDWGKPALFKIRLRSNAFFASSDIAVSLQVPPPYDGATHEQAEESRDYATLSRKITLRTTTEGEWTVVEIPALRPWGMIIVSRKKTPRPPAEPPAGPRGLRKINFPISKTASSECTVAFDDGFYDGALVHPGKFPPDGDGYKEKPSPSYAKPNGNSMEPLAPITPNPYRR